MSYKQLTEGQRYQIEMREGFNQSQIANLIGKRVYARQIKGTLLG